MHKSVPLRRKGIDLQFATSQALFSSASIDVGSNRLLRAIEANANRTFDSALDVGCGYGVLGITLAHLGLAQTVELIDRDALAIEFSMENTRANRIDRVTARGALDLSDAGNDDYDIVVSNLPGKSPLPVLRQIVYRSVDHLQPDGQFWGVVVNPLRAQIEAILDGLQTEVISTESGPRHTVFGLRIDETTSADQGAADDLAPYYRDEIQFVSANERFELRTVHGVGEFDGLAYSTQLLLEHLAGHRNRRFDRGVVINPGQGYLPIALMANGIVEQLELAGRDLLALRISLANLKSNFGTGASASISHRVEWLRPNPDESNERLLAVVTLRPDEPQKALDLSALGAIDSLGGGSVLAIAGESTPVTRLQRQIELRTDIRVLGRDRHRGYSVISLEKQS